MGEGCDAVALRAPLQGGAGGDQGDGGLRHGGGSALPGTRPAVGGGAASSGTSSSLFSSTSSLTDDGDVDDDATSSPPGRGGVSSSSLSSLTSSESETMQTGGAGVRPLYELSTMLDHLPALRTGLSKYYHGRSQSFQSLADVKCVEDLAKKTAPYSRRKKASRGCAAALAAKNRLSKTIAKRAPRGSPDRLICRARSTGLSLGSGKPPAYQGNRDAYRC